MAQSKRGRGRPKGSGKADKPLFADIAAIMLDHPTISRWAATNRVVKMLDPARRQGAEPDSIVRRLHRKWPVEGQAIFDQAKAERQRQAEMRRRSSRQIVGFQIPPGLGRVLANTPYINPALSRTTSMASLLRSNDAAVRAAIPFASVIRSHGDALRTAFPTLGLQQAALRSALPMLAIKHSLFSAFSNVPRLNIAPSALAALGIWR